MSKLQTLPYLQTSVKSGKYVPPASPSMREAIPSSVFMLRFCFSLQDSVVGFHSDHAPRHGNVDVGPPLCVCGEETRIPLCHIPVCAHCVPTPSTLLQQTSECM